MNKILTIILISITANLGNAQERIDLRKEDRSVSHLPISNLEIYPIFQNDLILKPLWVVNLNYQATVDRIIEPIIHRGLVFNYYNKNYAVDIESGNKIFFGSDDMKSNHGDNNYIAYSDRDSVHLISIISGKKIASFESDGINRLKIITDTIFYSYQKQGVFAYSIPKNKILWTWKERYASFDKITLFGDGFFVARSFYDFRTDSLVNSLLYLSNGELKKSADFLKERLENIIVNSNELFIYNDKELHAIDIKSWQLIWSRKGELNQSFLITNNELVSPGFRLEKSTGKIIDASKVGWMPHSIIRWNNGIILDILVDDSIRKFLVDMHFKNIYKIIFNQKDFSTCTLENFTDSGVFTFTKYSTNDITVAICKCDNGIYLYGFKHE